MENLDIAELIIQKPKYAQCGIHKVDNGYIMYDHATQDYIQVDFSGIDESENYYGDCISVKIDDLKVIK